MINTITLKEVLEAIDAGEVFSIGGRTCNQQKSTGGEWLFFPKAQKYRPATAAEEKAATQTTGAQGLLRNPNHFKWNTRNVVVMTSGQVIKFHIRLIRQFNGKTVL